MSKALKPEQLAAIMLLVGFPQNPKIIAEGMAVVEGESGFNPTITSDGVHIGLWQEESSFGTQADRENPVKSTKAAYDRWVADGNSFTDAWGKWDNMAQNNYPKYLSTAKRVVKEFGEQKIPGIVGHTGVTGEAEEVAGAAANAATGAVDFVGDLVSTLLNFRKMGELLAKIGAWFLRLIFKAIWDYCIAPLFHWLERAVSYYYKTFFSWGQTNGKGIYRENASIVTIIFWALGYGILWTTPDSPLKLANSARQSILGRSVRAVEGRISKRKLVKPKNVKEKTPPKPTPRESIVKVERTKEFSTTRKRPVTVDTTKGSEHGHTQNQGGEGGGVTTSALILPDGSEHTVPQRPAPKTTEASSAPQASRAGLDSQHSGSNSA